MYNGLDVVKKYGLEMTSARGDHKRSYLITDIGRLGADYKETRVVAMEKAMELDSNGADFVLWSGILDIAITQTILLSQGADAKGAYCGRLRELYKLLGLDVEIADLLALTGEDIPWAIDTAIRFTIPACGKFRLNELKEMYERMRSLARAA